VRLNRMEVDVAALKLYRQW